jgi:DNA-binding CsgD family transcriptional regulator
MRSRLDDVDPGLPDLADLAPAWARVVALRCAGEVVVVLSCRLVAPCVPPGLTGAEREVAGALARGLSNVAVARERGSRPRTVANQIQALYRKLGIASRAELLLVLFSGASSGPDGSGA